MDEKENTLGTPFETANLAEYQEGSIVSRTLIDRLEGTVTAFAFAQGQNLSEHTAPFDALVQITEGEGLITVGGRQHTLKAGQGIIMPAGIPHSVAAEKPFKMVLTMIKSRSG
jgi:quercetin dioxygenase-like cupin family protein